MVRTVCGEVAADKLGVTMMHEHLVPYEEIPRYPECDRFVEPYTIETVVKELNQAKRFGLSSIVDATPFGPHRNVSVLQEVSSRTGINIIASTGFYKEPHIPAFVYNMSLNQVVDHIVKELTEGIGDSSIKAGIIKVGSSMKRISPVEEKVIRAAARAHRETGAPITTHATVGTMGPAQVAIFEEEGVDFDHVVIGHSGLNASFSYHEAIAKHGASVGFDTIGKERFDYVRMETAGINRYEYEKEQYYIPDELQLRSIVNMVKAGYASRIVLSEDLSRRESYINPHTFGCLGYSYLLARFVPALKEAGVPEEAIQQILVENPRRILDIRCCRK